MFQVGLASVQIARAMGLRVLGTAGTPEGLQLVKANGAAEVFNHREEGYAAKITVSVTLSCVGFWNGLVVQQ